jgi:site-specific recombinase XerD
MSEPARRRDGARIEAFLEMLAAERGASVNTLAAYRRDLDDAGEAIGDLTRAPPEALEAFAADLAARGLSPATAARRISALRQFYRFLLVEGDRGDDPTARLTAPRRGRPLPKTSWNPARTVLTIQVGRQVDTVEFDMSQPDHRTRLKSFTRSTL